MISIDPTTKRLIYAGAFLAALIVVTALLISSLRTDEVNTPPDEPVATTSALYSFDEYATSASFVGRPAAPDFTTNSKADRFKTRITEGSAAGPNFAGTYTVVEWGCGTSCQSHAIVDARTGRIAHFGLISAYGLEYHLSSALLVVNPAENLKDVENLPTDVTTDYYLLSGADLELLARQKPGESEAIMCAQVVTSAVNPVSGERLDFGSPCSVPYGWTIESAPVEPPQAACYVGGCSSQLCSDVPDRVSTCEWTEAYACYRTATCERQQNGACGWTETAELTQCLANAR